MSVDYEYIESLSCYGVIANNVFERSVERRREVWFGSDASGMLREKAIASRFFSDDQRERWEQSTRASAARTGGPHVMLFAPGCWGGPRAGLARLPETPDAIAQAFERRGGLTLHHIKQLLGEALVPEAVRRIFFDLAAGLPGATVDRDATDQLGRRGLMVGRAERRHRQELVFDTETLALLGSREVLISDEPGYASAGATTGWTSYINRQRVPDLPDGTLGVPDFPCSPAGAGRGTRIRDDLTFSTGYFTDIRPHADQWLSAGLITDAEYEALLSEHPAA